MSQLVTQNTGNDRANLQLLWVGEIWGGSKVECFDDVPLWYVFILFHQGACRLLLQSYWAELISYHDLFTLAPDNHFFSIGQTLTDGASTSEIELLYSIKVPRSPSKNFDVAWRYISKSLSDTFQCWSHLFMQHLPVRAGQWTRQIIQEEQAFSIPH